jgi:hypothetical protein
VAIDEVEATMSHSSGPDAPADRPSDEDGDLARHLVAAVAGAVALKERLGLEYDKIIILAAIASRHVAGAIDGPGEIPGGARVRDSLLRWNGSTMSLARTLGIPRETVRRKLVELHDEGWIIPDGRNLRYQPSQRLLRTLADLLPPRQGSA